MSETSILLCGLKHSGKSTLSVRLAAELHLAHYDLDMIVESTYRADRLVSCRDIYERHGMEYFMELEAPAAKTLAEELRATQAVAALGGGTGENAAAMEELRGAGLLVYLRDTEERLYDRIMRRGRPAFLPESDPEEAFHRLFVRRDELYASAADMIIDIDGLDEDQSYSRLRTPIVEKFHAG